MAKEFMQNPHHSNEFEMEARVEFTCRLMRNMKFKHEIKLALKDEFGIEHRQCERYIAKARARILSDSSESKGQYGAVLTDKLSEIIGSETSVANKIRAIEVMAKILGLNLVNVNQTVTMSGSELDVRRGRIVEALNLLKASSVEVGGQTMSPGFTLSDMEVKVGGQRISDLLADQQADSDEWLDVGVTMDSDVRVLSEEEILDFSRDPANGHEPS